ncbi:VHS-domain-containing protein, partial [Ramicandelaber brevisporus]
MEELKRQILELAKPSATDIDNPTLERLIVRACNPALTGSNLALNIEICELINRKKGNWPHDAAFLVAKYSNSLNASQALLALELLDVCVKNCGHAFHLQIGSKDFLNELVRRFPEFPSQQHAQPKLRERIPVNNRILQFIQEWRTTLCVNSRFKDDLRKIEDMARMLEFKGYKLPTLEGKSEVLLGPRDSLRTVEEIEREDSDALKAKLQELLRRATPTDLAEANRIMQILAGYDEEGDARREQLQSQWEEEIASVESRANLLIDLLKDMNPGDVLDE